MSGLRTIELMITGAAALATILATYFAWRAVREGKDTVALARETVEVGKETLGIETENLSSLQETTRIGRESLQLAQPNLQAARQEHALIERDHLIRRLTAVADAVVQTYLAANRIQSHVVTAGLELAAARARLRSALVGLPQELKETRNLIHQGGDPAGLGIILRTWDNALREVEDAVEALNESN